MAPTPRTESNWRAMVLSTNQLRASTSMLGELTVYASTGDPARLTLLITGSRTSAGRLERTCVTAERTSSSASWPDFSRRNSAVMVTPPSCTRVVMCLSPWVVAMAFSSLRATSVSSCAGAAPGKEALTVIVGRSRSGKFCTFMALKDSKPANVSITNSINDATGFLMDQAETFMDWAPYFGLAALLTRTVSPSFKNPAPVTAIVASGPMPSMISTDSLMRRPICTFCCATLLLASTLNR